jgi:asparagine synthase (glutamine-hydrolysing)
MSAVAGIIHFNDEPVSHEHISNIMKSLEAFPSDDIQIWNKENVFFGCHAQWITPESVGETIPFYDSERKCLITADAIIDNRKELLEKLGVNFKGNRTISDSQIILYSYYKWGLEFPRFLVGDFAFMIWDENANRILGGRDYTGSRTLYYYQNEMKFAFSTLIKPLLCVPFIPDTLNEEWLAEYLAIPTMLDSIDPGQTIYKNIHQIPPSHTILIENGRVKVSKFNVLSDIQKLKLKSNGEYEEAFRETLQLVVKEKTRTFKNVGAQLSGGLDSGTVVSFAANSLRSIGKSIKTYSYVPTDDFIDFTPKNRLANETPFIESTVQHVGIENAQYLDFKGKSTFTEINEMLDIMEMPYKFQENSTWLKGTYEKASQENVGVLLNGAGGNFTISWGPSLEYYAQLLKNLKLMHLKHEINQYSLIHGINQKRVYKAISKSLFMRIRSIFQTESSNYPVLISEGFANKTDVFNKLRHSNASLVSLAPRNGYEVRNEWFSKGLYWNTYGTAATKLSLKYSVWNRDPTNDLRVIKFSLSVPEEQYVQNGIDRSLIRRSTIGILPDDVRLNFSTRGIQGADWVHRLKPDWKRFIEELKEISCDSTLSEILNNTLLKNLVTKYESEPKSEYAFNPEVRVLMRALIVSRFLKKLI